MPHDVLKTPRKLVFRENVDVCIICCDTTKKGRRCLNTSKHLLDELTSINTDFKQLFAEFCHNRQFHTCSMCANRLIKNIRRRERIKPLEIELESEITEIKKSSQLFLKSFVSKKRIHSSWSNILSVVSGVTVSDNVSRSSHPVTLHCRAGAGTHTTTSNRPTSAVTVGCQTAGTSMDTILATPTKSSRPTTSDIQQSPCTPRPR